MERKITFRFGHSQALKNHISFLIWRHLVFAIIGSMRGRGAMFRSEAGGAWLFYYGKNPCAIWILHYGRGCGRRFLVPMRRPLPTAGRDSARCGRKSRDGVRRALRGGRASAFAGSRACRGGKRGRRDVPNPKYAISFVCAVRFGYLWTFES